MDIIVNRGNLLPKSLTFASYWSEFISAINLAMAFSVSSSFLRNFSISINWSVSLFKSFNGNCCCCCCCCVCSCCSWYCLRDEDRFVAAVWADKLALYKSLPRASCWWVCVDTISAECFGWLVPRILVY